MALVVLGVLFVLMRWFAIEPVAQWPWWLLLSPFGLALLWWAWSDASGRTRRLQDQKFDKLKANRRARATEGLHLRRRRK
jgi:small Trp-rich protein